MSSIAKTLLSTTRDRHEDLRNLVSSLPDSALTWQPSERAPAIAGLVLHVLDVEGHLTAVASGIDDRWAGEDGSRIHERASEAELVAAIDAVGDGLEAALERADAAVLSSPTPQGAETVVEALIQDLDHVAVHVGHLQLTRELYESAHPDAPRTYEHWGREA